MSYSEDLSYSVVGMITIDQDGPGFCTPIFRNRDGKKYFLQSSRVGRMVDEYVHVGDKLPVASYIAYRNNGEFRVGDRLRIGFRMPDGSVFFGKKTDVYEMVYARLAELSEYPFIVLQIARRLRSNDAIKEALGHDDVRNAVMSEWIELRSNEPRFVWTKANEEKLYSQFWEGISLNEIAKSLGISRSAVLSKVKRSPEIRERQAKERQRDLFGGRGFGARQAVPDPSIDVDHISPNSSVTGQNFSKKAANMSVLSQDAHRTIPRPPNTKLKKK